MQDSDLGRSADYNHRHFYVPLSRQVRPPQTGIVFRILDYNHGHYIRLRSKNGNSLNLFFHFFKFTIFKNFQYIHDPPPQIEVIKGLFIPGCAGCGPDGVLQAVGVVGAVIMPHNLFLHSALVKVIVFLPFNSFHLLMNLIGIVA